MLGLDICETKICITMSTLKFSFMSQCIYNSGFLSHNISSYTLFAVCYAGPYLLVNIHDPVRGCKVYTQKTV